MSSLCRLMYSSLADVTESAARRLLVRQDIYTRSTRNNEASRITGALLCGPYYFTQVLEGPFGAVMDVMARIRADERHSEIEVLRLIPAMERDFPGWAMAYVDPVITDSPLTHHLIKRAREGHGRSSTQLYQLIRSQVVDDWSDVAGMPGLFHGTVDTVGAGSDPGWPLIGGGMGLASCRESGADAQD